MTDRPAIMVIFGASGDLTRRKLMPALCRLDADGLLDRNFRIVGFARSEKTDDEFRREMGESVHLRSAGCERFLGRLHYVTGNYNDPGSFTRLKELLTRTGGVPLFYLALPYEAARDVAANLDSSDLLSGENGGRARIMVEKPFGIDLETARELNGLLKKRFDESRIYRIDHYLGKETVRNLLVFRFANAIFEPLWNSEHIDSIQITTAEEIGVEGRGGYYEQAGVVRDMIQNHLLQVLALTAMEPPLAGDPESVRDKKVEIFKSLSPIGPEDFVFGQYDGYRKEKGVAADSCMPTYAAVRLYIGNWRWKGVPFLLRSGKKLAAKVTEVAVRFRDVPVCVLENSEACRSMQPNILTIRIQPDEGIRLRFNVESPGREDRLGSADLDFRYSDMGGELEEAYERVLLDCMRGIPTLFWRADGVEAAWKAVEPLLDAQEKCCGKTLCRYAAGTWGPDEAARLLGKERSWIKTGKLS